MSGLPLKPRQIVLSSKVISTSGFDGRHFEFRMSTDVVRAISGSGVVENVSSVDKISFVVVIQAKITCFKLISKYFWFSDRHIAFLVGVEYESNHITGKVTKARPLIPSGSEMAAKRVVWGQFTTPPPPVHGVRVNLKKTMRLYIKIWLRRRRKMVAPPPAENVVARRLASRKLL